MKVKMTKARPVTFWKGKLCDGAASPNGTSVTSPDSALA